MPQEPPPPPGGFAFAAGYAASVYSWPVLRAWLTGAETEIRSLKDKIKALRARF